MHTEQVRIIMICLSQERSVMHWERTGKLLCLSVLNVFR